MFGVTLLCETTPLKPRGSPAGWSFTPISVDWGESGLDALRKCAYHFPWVQQESRAEQKTKKEKKISFETVDAILAPPSDSPRVRCRDL